jgi:hypothetical protein
VEELERKLASTQNEIRILHDKIYYLRARMTTVEHAANIELWDFSFFPTSGEENRIPVSDLMPKILEILRRKIVWTPRAKYHLEELPEEKK